MALIYPIRTWFWWTQTLSWAHLTIQYYLFSFISSYLSKLFESQTILFRFCLWRIFQFPFSPVYLIRALWFFQGKWAQIFLFTKWACQTPFSPLAYWHFSMFFACSWIALYIRLACRIPGHNFWFSIGILPSHYPSPIQYPLKKL